ncbi:MAG: hypothetical protein ABJB97_02800 [Acidobacteriota bacterium]
MKLKTLTLQYALAILLTLSIPSSTLAQHKHGEQKKSAMAGMKMDMSMMMNLPHHKLMTGYMKSMSAFAESLRDQAVRPEAFDVEVARATVAELRHDLDAMEALHQKHMDSMSPEMKAKMKMMMEKMDKQAAEMKDQIGALETDVQTDKPDSRQIAVHANALIKHLGMMSMMHGGDNTPKKKMGMKMDMKKM